MQVYITAVGANEFLVKENDSLNWFWVIAADDPQHYLISFSKIGDELVGGFEVAPWNGCHEGEVIIYDKEGSIMARVTSRGQVLLGDKAPEYVGAIVFNDGEDQFLDTDGTVIFSYPQRFLDRAVLRAIHVFLYLMRQK